MNCVINKDIDSWCEFWGSSDSKDSSHVVCCDTV